MEKKLRERAALLRAVRSFFYDNNYLEVETPIRQPVIIPESEIMPMVSQGWFLQTSPELAMKRLLAQGEERIWQICKCFRAQERGRLHLPEFTMLEWYRLNGEYQSLMNETRDLVVAMAAKLGQSPGFDHDFCSWLCCTAWQRLSVREAFLLYGRMDADEAVAIGSFDEILVELVEPNLGIKQPCFLYDYPASLASLARLKKQDQTLAERFELYIGGLEIANGFSELTDDKQQRQRFLAELDDIKLKYRQLPEKFLDALTHIPSACGIAVGFDRLLMALTGAVSIDQVVAFTPEEL